MVFKAIDANDYKVFIVLDEFLTGAPFNSSLYDGYGYLSELTSRDISHLKYLQKMSDSFKLLGNRECISSYSERFLSGKRDLLLFADGVYDANLPAQNSSILEMLEISLAGGFLSDGDPTAWLCSTETDGFVPYCDHRKLDARNWTVQGYNIKYCRSEIVKEQCQLQFSRTIGTTVIICNTVKFCCMIIAAFKLDRATLCTLG